MPWGQRGTDHWPSIRCLDPGFNYKPQRNKACFSLLETSHATQHKLAATPYAHRLALVILL